MHLMKYNHEQKLISFNSDTPKKLSLALNEEKGALTREVCCLLLSLVKYHECIPPVLNEITLLNQLLWHVLYSFPEVL